MTFQIIFLKEFGKAFVPKRMAPNLRRYLLKAGFNEVPYRFFGLLFYTSALITTIIYVIFLYPQFKKLSLFEVYIYSFLGWAAIQLFFATLFILIVYFYLDLKIFYRTKKMEEELPEFLQVLSSNLKGGMTFESALWSAVKPRFSILGSEMGKASKKVMTGYEVGKALTELSEKYDSLMLNRAVDLIISELESGGNAADLLDRIVDNLREVKELKDEMSASAIAYIIFISVIVLVISPLLFALSFHLLNLILKFVGQLAFAAQRTSALPFMFSKVNINPQDFKTFSMISIVIISFFASLIVSIVEKGDIKSGVKYVPIYTFGSMLMYLLLTKAFGTLFSGLV